MSERGQAEGRCVMIFDRVLILSPHTDDGELGAGGTVAKFIEKGV